MQSVNIGRYYFPAQHGFQPEYLSHMIDTYFKYLFKQLLQLADFSAQGLRIILTPVSNV